MTVGSEYEASEVTSIQTALPARAMPMGQNAQTKEVRAIRCAALWRRHTLPVCQ